MLSVLMLDPYIKKCVIGTGCLGGSDLSLNPLPLLVASLSRERKSKFDVVFRLPGGVDKHRRPF